MNPILKSLFVVASAAFFLLSLDCAAASAVVTNPHPRISDPGSVQLLYAAPDQPYEVVGTISSEGRAGWTKQGRMDRAIRKIKERAAKIGANAVILEGQGVQAGGNAGTFLPMYGGGGMMVGGTAMYETLHGTAIFIKKSANP